MAMRASPPLKAKFLFDEKYELKATPILVSQTAPLIGTLGDTIRVDLMDDGDQEPPPQSCWDKACGSSDSSYFHRVGDTFGWRFVIMLTSVYFGVKGTLINLVSLAKLPYYRQAGIGPKQYQQYDVVTKAPWAVKAWFGAMSDLYPWGGYAKRTYMTAVSVVGAAACALLAVATNVPSIWQSGSPLVSVPAITLDFMGVNLQGAVVDLLAEGRYTAAMAQAPLSGSDLVSWVWACVQGGQFVSAALVGFAADSHRIHVLFLGAAILAVQVIPFSEAGWLGDPRVAPQDRGFQWGKLRANPRVFVLAFLMALCGVALAVCNLLDAPWQWMLSLSLSASVGLCALAFWALPLVLAKCNLYLYLCSVLYVNISGAVDYFYVAGPSCVPDGPHFSFRYYITYSSVVQAAFGYLGVLLFQACMRKWTFRQVLWTTVVLEVAAGMVDLVIVKRWNTKVGVPDAFMYMLGYNMVFQVASMLNFMPSVVLVSKLCPPKLESTVFAVLAGFQNFGGMVSGSLGACLIHVLGIRTAAVPLPTAEGPSRHRQAECDFSGLPLGIVLSHMVLPLVTVPLTFLLLPHARLTDTIDVTGAVSPPPAPVSEGPDSSRSGQSSKADRAEERPARGSYHAPQPRRVKSFGDVDEVAEEEGAPAGEVAPLRGGSPGAAGSSAPGPRVTFRP